jgi:hypothetical protein
MSVASTFDTAYVLSKDPRIQALFAGYMGFPGTALDPTTRYNTAFALATSGLLIDAPIDAFAGDPYITMFERQQYGYTWVPSALAAPITLAPGLTFPGVPSYNANPPYPPGSIVVSTNLADYPPFEAPVIPPAAVPYVGSYAGGGFYFASEAAQTIFKPGQDYQQNGVNYYFVIAQELMGNTYLWRVVGT